MTVTVILQEAGEEWNGEFKWGELIKSRSVCVGYGQAPASELENGNRPSHGHTAS